MYNTHMKIACVGEITVDRYIGGNDYAGGTTFNVARIIKRIDPVNQVFLVSAIGNDEKGKYLLENVTESGVTPALQKINGKSSLIEIKIADKERHLQNYAAGVIEKFELDESQIKILKDSDIAIYVCFKDIEHLFVNSLSYPKKALKVADFTDLLDYNKDLSIVRKTINKLDVLFFGLQKSDTKLIDELESLSSKFDKLIIVTLGEHGSIAFFENKKFEVPAQKVINVIDPTGAGDTFLATFINSYAKGENIRLSLKKASVEASKTIQRMGVL